MLVLILIPSKNFKASEFGFKYSSDYAKGGLRPPGFASGTWVNYSLIVFCCYFSISDPSLLD